MAENNDYEGAPPGGLSVIIPAVNERPSIRRAVAGAFRCGAGEVLVVDGGSGDGTPQEARDAGATVLSSPRGRDVQQNLGARHASGAVLLFLHADNWLGPTVGSQLTAALRDPAVLGGAFHQQIDASGIGFRLLERGNALRVRLRGLAYGDQAIFIRREFFFQLGGFPEVPIMEDLLLMRAFRRVARPVLLPGPVHVDARRWRERGIVRQTLRNWSLVAALKLGVPPARLARRYPAHDVTAAKASNDDAHEGHES